MSYYYCNETDEILSSDTLRTDYYSAFAPEYESFDDFISACMYWNNGALIPIPDRINSLRRRLRSVLSFIRDECEREWYEDEIDNLTAEINELEQYINEEEE